MPGALPHLAPAEGSPPRLGVVIFTRNDARHLEACLARLKEDPPPFPLEVVVYDNASVDDTEAVCLAHPQVRYLGNREEVGFSTGNNRGLLHIRAPWVLFLNPDTLPEGRILAELVEALESDSSLGLLAPPLRYPDGRHQPSAWEGESGWRRWAGPFREARHPSPHQVVDVGWALGAALAGPTEFLRKIKGFDESFWFFATDLELAARVRREGRRVALLGTRPLVHVGSENWNEERRRRIFAGRLRYVARERGRGEAGLLRGALFLVSLARSLQGTSSERQLWRSLARGLLKPLPGILAADGPGGHAGEALRRPQAP